MYGSCRRSWLKEDILCLIAFIDRLYSLHLLCNVIISAMNIARFLLSRSRGYVAENGTLLGNHDNYMAAFQIPCADSFDSLTKIAELHVVHADSLHAACPF